MAERTYAILNCLFIIGNFFYDDGVHISALGNEIFLYRIQQAFQTFLTTQISVSSHVENLDHGWLYVDVHLAHQAFNQLG